MAHKVRFAASLPSLGVEAVPFVQRAEALGFDSIWLSDLPTMADGDPIVTLAALAVATERVHLGTNLVPFGRNPMVLARQLAHVDQLSGGRLLVTLVPGIGRGQEREALGLGDADRGDALEEVVGLLRRWWAGETVTHRSARFAFSDLGVEPRPVQEPLEVWFGGHGPWALERVGALGDGWLTAGLDPAGAGEGRRRIEEAAASAGRVVDPEHFGISLPYARTALSDEVKGALEARYRGQRAEDLVPVGADGLRALVGEYLDAGLSKFVLRPIGLVPGSPGRGAPGRGDAPRDTAAEDELAWLAEVVLPLQT